MSQLEKGQADCPFAVQDGDLVNVKFFRGTRDDLITRDEIFGQFRSAKMQRAQGLATVTDFAPRSDHPVMDVRELVAGL